MFQKLFLMYLSCLTWHIFFIKINQNVNEGIEKREVFTLHTYC